MWHDAIRLECELEVLSFMHTVDWDLLGFNMHLKRAALSREAWRALPVGEQKRRNKESYRRHGAKKRVKQRELQRRIKETDPDRYVAKCKLDNERLQAKLAKMRVEDPAAYARYREKRNEIARKYYAKKKQTKIAEVNGRKMIVTDHGDGVTSALNIKESRRAGGGR